LKLELKGTKAVLWNNKTSPSRREG